jgi:hypothetical protein
MRRFGRLCINWDPPRHLVLPTISGLGRLLARIGFEPRQLKTSARAATFCSGAARQYRSGRCGQGLDFQPHLADRLFHGVEWTLVTFGVPVGEEIQVVAVKPRYS